MSIDWFLARICESVSDVPAAKMADLSRQAEDFLRVGKGLSWSEWSDLGPESRAAFLDAANRILVEKTALQGLANQGGEAALEMLATVDHGRAKLASVMTRVMVDATRKLQASSAVIP